MRNFAFGEDVLPRDVNVDRVERRTGHRFTGAAAQALMDLGATVCLARIPRCDACPLAADVPVARHERRAGPQAEPFEGSFRQRRAATLRLVAAATAAREELDGEAVDALARDGLVVLLADGRVALPVAAGALAFSPIVHYPRHDTGARRHACDSQRALQTR